MICAVCREGMASLWQPKNPRKLGHIKEFPEVLRHQHPKLKEDDDVDEMLSMPPPCFIPTIHSMHPVTFQCTRSKISAH